MLSPLVPLQYALFHFRHSFSLTKRMAVRHTYSMEYLQRNEMIALLKASHSYGNREAHLALLVMYATGTRVSQALALKGVDIIPDTVTGGHRIRIFKAKRGKTRTFRVLVSPDPALDMRDLVALAKERGTSKLFGGLSRQYLHNLVKKFAATAGLHADMVHAHTIRHSAAMRVYEKTQRIGAVSGFLTHSDPSAAYVYVQENDGQFADDAMAAVFAGA
jgi:integrase/recombinase XerD